MSRSDHANSWTIHNCPIARVDIYIADRSLISHSIRPLFILPASGALKHGGSHDFIVDENQTLLLQPGATRVERCVEVEGRCFGLIIAPNGELRERMERVASQATLRGAHAQAATHQLIHGCADGAAAVAVILRDLASHRQHAKLRSGARERLERARAHLLFERKQNTSVADIARHVGLQPRHLTTQFRRSFGLPIHAYETRLRLNSALVELPLTDNIVELSLALGFSSHSHFTSAFRSTYGMTPSHFRDAVRSVAGAKPLGDERARLALRTSQLRSLGHTGQHERRSF